MTKNRMRALLATYQVGAGLGGLWLLATQARLGGPLMGRVMAVVLAAGFCVLLIAAGVLLGRRHELGVHLSFYGQVAQLVYLVSTPLTYVFFAPATVMISITSQGWFQFGAELGTRVSIAIGKSPEVGAFGINLLAAAALYLLSTRFRSKVAVPKALAT